MDCSGRQNSCLNWSPPRRAMYWFRLPPQRLGRRDGWRQIARARFEGIYAAILGCNDLRVCSRRRVRLRCCLYAAPQHETPPNRSLHTGEAHYAPSHCQLRAALHPQSIASSTAKTLICVGNTLLLGRQRPLRLLPQRCQKVHHRAHHDLVTLIENHGPRPNHPERRA